MSAWQRGKLGDFLTLQRGFDLPAYDRKPGNVPVVTSSGISGFPDEARVIGPGVVMGRYGTIGEIFYIEEDFWPHNTSLYVKDFKGNDPKFVSYFLRTIHYDAHNDKSSVPGLNRNHLHLTEVVFPPSTEQRAIASILGSLDDKIELNRRTNATLEEIARALFTSWFVDFEPVRAKAEGRAPQGMDEASAALFPDGFEETALGRAPRGWRVVPLPEAIAVNPARPLKKDELAPYLDMQNMPTIGHRAIEWILRPFGSGMRFINGDTLLARITPCLENGKTAFVDFLEEGQVGWGSTEYIVLHPKSPLPAEYGYLLARTDALRTHAIQNMTGSSGRQRVPAETFWQFPVVVPSEAVALRFGDAVQPLMRSIKANDEQSRTLAALRDTLLPRLLSGELRVGEAEGAL